MRLRNIYAANDGMRMWRAQDSGVRRAGENEIVRIAAGALNQRLILYASDRLA
jgi:hypothetical protein